MSVRPSALAEVFWSHSLNDLTTLVSIKSQEHMASHFQMYESFRLVVDEALGGSSDPEPDANDAIQSMDELTRAFAALGGAFGQ